MLKKRFLPVFLSFTLVFASVSSVPVLASDSEVYEEVIDAMVMAKYGVTALGAIINPFSDFDGFLQKSENLRDYYAGGVKATSKTENGKTTLEVDPAFMSALYDTLVKAIGDSGGYVLLTDTGVTFESKMRSLGAYGNQQIKANLEKLYSLFPNPKIMFGSTYAFAVFDDSLYYYLSPTGAVMYFDPETGARQVMPNTYEMPIGMQPNDLFVASGVTFSSLSFSRYSGTAQKVFNSENALKEYLAGGRNFFVNSSFPGSAPSNFSVDKDVLYANDWNDVNQKVYKSIIDMVDGNNYTSDADIQKVVDDMTDELLKNLNDINQNIDKNNMTLDEILSAITATGNNQTAWLAKIYDFLKYGMTGEKSVSELLTKIYDLLKNGVGGGGSGGDMSIVESTLADMLLELEKSNDSLDTIINQIDSLTLLISAEGGLNALFNLLRMKSSDTAEVAKTKFPTSIPWDVGIIVGKLRATPEAPKFEIPFAVSSMGYEESVEIDLTKFEKVSDASRGLLSLTFMLFLLVLTRKLFGGDD